MFEYHRAGSLFANVGIAFPQTPGLAKTEAIWTFSTPLAGSLLANGGATSPPTPALFKLCKKTSSIILPAKTEPIWTGSEPVIKTLCLQMGGGLPPPPTPPLSFYAVQACFQEHRTMNKNCFKHIEVIDLFKSHHACGLFANAGATSPEAIWAFSEPVTCVCKMGGAAPPQSPLSFYAVQACFQKHRTINTTCFTSIIVLELFKPIMLAVHLQKGGLRPPQPSHFFKLYKATASIILLAKTEPIWPFSRTRDKDVVCANWREAAPPPHSPRFSFHAVQICFQEHRTINQNCFKNPSCRQMGGLHPTQLSRFLSLCKNASSIILPAKTEPIWTLSEPVIKKIYDEPE